MSIHLMFAALAMGAMQPLAADPRHVGPDDDDDPLWPLPRFNDYRRMPSEPDYLTVVCPRCGAAVGKPCDRRSLGRHSEHKARVEAAYAVRRGV